MEPRAAGHVRLKDIGRPHPPHRARVRRHHPAAAADGARRQAGNAGGRAERRAAANLAWASAGTTSSTKDWVRTSTTGASAPRSRLSCCARSGPTRLWTSRADGTASPARASSRSGAASHPFIWFGGGRSDGVGTTERRRSASPAEALVIPATALSWFPQLQADEQGGWETDGALQGSGRRGGTLAG